MLASWLATTALEHQMTTRADRGIPKPDSFLVQVLEQNEHIHELIKHSAEELFSVNTGIRHKLADLPPGVKIALDKNETVVRNLQDAAEGLAAMKQALLNETRQRIMVDHQLAAAVEQEAGARDAALHDNLTGLPNRVLFKDRLQHGIAQAKRHRWILAVMFVDLDNFKTINDTYGHQTGDVVLQTVAMRLKHNTRGDDTVSRYGGDEFLCLLTHLHEQKDIEVIATKLLRAIRAQCNVSVRDVIVNPSLGASIGIALYPKDGATASALIKSADEAMYGAKENNSGYAFAR
jgi:diguanylate cyclase (GGDEF)-like protein